MRKLADRHTNTVMVGIPHVLEGRGKTEQVCRDKECIKVSALLKIKTTVFEMTHTLHGIDGKLEMEKKRLVNLKTQHRRKD